ncbi:hypothetical protein D3C84_1034500 [compost metagenome]
MVGIGAGNTTAASCDDLTGTAELIEHTLFCPHTTAGFLMAVAVNPHILFDGGQRQSTTTNELTERHDRLFQPLGPRIFWEKPRHFITEHRETTRLKDQHGPAFS